MKNLNEISLKTLIEDETSERFTKRGYIKCPFHNEKTPSLKVKFSPDKNKEIYHCFGCEAHGDALDFVMKYKNLSYVEAREFLGMEVKKDDNEKLLDNLNSYIEKQLKGFRKGDKLLALFTYVDKENNPIYYKAKFLKTDGKKHSSYYHFQDGKIINKRGSEEIPYNYFEVFNALKEERIIIIVEGEKDANTINSFFKNKKFVATSIKGIKDLEKYFQDFLPKIYVLGDTGEAGEKYKKFVYDCLFQNCKEFKFITLPGLKSLGNNKDVTDWIEAFEKNKYDLLESFNRSLNLKSKYDLQQDNLGIYKLQIKEKNEEIIEHKIYLTNFKILDALRIKFVDKDEEGVKLILKSCTNKIIEKIIPSSSFDDIKSFKNSLGTLDLSFKKKINELTELKEWINKYFAIETQEIHDGIKFMDTDKGLKLITNQGTLNASTNLTLEAISNGTNTLNIADVDTITKDEMKELKKHLFKFATPEKSICIIGTIVNNLAVFQNKEIKEKLHHLLICGESASGKSTILENIVVPLLNYSVKDLRSIGLISPFAFIKTLSEGNYPVIFDEFKPSFLDRYKVLKLSETLRNAYDRAIVSRGDRTFHNHDFELNRPVILAGEESYPNGEKALLERSCIVYLSRGERNSNHTKAMNWLKENSNTLNKLGKSLLETILNLKVKTYQEIRKTLQKSTECLKNRPLTTYVNICCGIEIINLLLEELGLNKIINYQHYVISNIKEEILGTNDDTYSVVEQMLILYNDMAENGRIKDTPLAAQINNGQVYIRTSEMLNQIQEHIKRVNADLIPLSLSDFKKQAKKSGYIKEFSSAVVKFANKAVRFDKYDLKLLQNLKIDFIAPPDLVDCTKEDAEIIPMVIGD